MLGRGLVVLTGLAALPALADGMGSASALHAARASPSAEEVASRPRFAILGGVGLAYLGLGYDFALALPHLEPFVALGALTALRGLVGGLRYFPADATDRGFVLTLTGGQFLGGSGSDIPTLLGGTLTAGYRFGIAPGPFAEIGGGVLIAASRYEGEAWEARLGVDVDLAVGCSF